MSASKQLSASHKPMRKQESDSAYIGLSPSHTPCRSYDIRFNQSAYFIKPGRSNHFKYQYEEGAVKVRPSLLPDLSNASRSVLNSST